MTRKCFLGDTWSWVYFVRSFILCKRTSSEDIFNYLCSLISFCQLNVLFWFSLTLHPFSYMKNLIKDTLQLHGSNAFLLDPYFYLVLFNIALLFLRDKALCTLVYNGDSNRAGTKLVQLELEFRDRTTQFGRRSPPGMQASSGRKMTATHGRTG